MVSKHFSPYKDVLAPLFRKYKKPTFLASNSEQPYLVILKSSKNNDLFQNRQTYSHQILEISRNFYDMISVMLQMNVIRKSEAKEDQER